MLERVLDWVLERVLNAAQPSCSALSSAPAVMCVASAGRGRKLLH